MFALSASLRIGLECKMITGWYMFSCMVLLLFSFRLCSSDNTSLYESPTPPLCNIMLNTQDPNCACLEPNVTCNCHKTKSCPQYSHPCVPVDRKCDGHNDCGQWEDEENCSCKADLFQCQCYQTLPCENSGCILAGRVCDGYNDCGDWSDEKGCISCPHGHIACECYKYRNCTYGKGCVNALGLCNGNDLCWGEPPNRTYTYPAHIFQCDWHKNVPFHIFARSNRGCVLQNMVCNGKNDCGDWSDEKGCACPSSKFQCACYASQSCFVFDPCIKTSLVCDGRNDCGDWSDEKNCTCSSHFFSCDCHHNYSCLSDIGCYHETSKCNFRYDCSDRSDEKGCECPVERFRCDCHDAHTCIAGSACIEISKRCDGRNDCGDWSDENGCHFTPDEIFMCNCYRLKNCHFSRRKPLQDKNTISTSQVCDGVVDCSDRSDENVDCECPTEYFRCKCRSTNTCHPPSGCIAKEQLCDGKNDCGDWSDELYCKCAENEFECACNKHGNCRGRGCLKLDIFREDRGLCDGKNSCGDWSDEFNCSLNSFFTAKCANQTVISRRAICDGKADCEDGSDEANCGFCVDSHTRCGFIFKHQKDNNSTVPGPRCILSQWVSDGYSDCDDASDEPCVTSSIWCDKCPVTVSRCGPDVDLMSFEKSGTHCANTQTCSQNLTTCQLNGRLCATPSCHDSTKHCNELFSCEDGKTFISNRYFCDGSSELFRTCPDESDEQMQGLGFRCAGVARAGECLLPQINLYDDVAQCADKSDLCFVNGSFKCFQCLDGINVISTRQVCDEVVDCHDLSDECLCGNQSTCNAILGNSNRACPDEYMPCLHAHDCVEVKSVICNESIACANDSNFRSCYRKGPQRQVYDAVYCQSGTKASKCDGRPTCLLYEDECNCPNPPSFCDDPCISSFNTAGPRSFPPPDNKAVCDGIPEADSYYHLLSTFHKTNCTLCDERNCPMRFLCPSKGLVSIDVTGVCDGTIDCDDGTDEDVSRCYASRFYCDEVAKLSIDIRFRCDAIKDCENGLDESRELCKKRFYCDNGKPISIDADFRENGVQDCEDGSDECVSLFSDPYELIADPFFRAMFWLMGIIAIFGNMVVFIFTARQLVVDKKNNAVSKCSKLMIISLSASDCLMGVYLIATVSKGLEFSGHYCLDDKKWRSSMMCSVLGVIVVISSEASVLTMTTMATYRLVSVYRPFLTQNFQPSRIVYMLTVCWLLAVTLAVIPLIQFDSGYFVSTVWFPNELFDKDEVSRQDITALAGRLIGKNVSSWHNVKNIVRDKLPFNFIKREIGYYGETSVCMPRLFSSQAWHYSTMLITVNFVTFLYIVTAYVLIYKRSSRMNMARNKDPSSEMQKRISRLIITDFACWIPICLMGYLSLASVDLPPEAYVASAGLLLPVNSALNPLIYSNVIANIFTGSCTSFRRLLPNAFSR